MKKGKQLMAGLLLFAFIGLLAVSIVFIMKTPDPQPPIINESFSGAPPTRASKCNCIPGYIPSNVNVNKSGKITQIKDTTSGTYVYYYTPTDTTNLYVINLNNTCGLPLKPSDRTMNSNNYAQAMNYAGNVGQLTCDVVSKEKVASSTYFCQNLSNPADQIPCYKS